jgi:hypothetical protein
MQELTDSVKRPNLIITDMEEEEVQAKDMCDIFTDYRKLPKPREIYAHTGTRSLQSPKQTGSK